MLKGIECIHKHNIIHADLKLPNLLMVRESEDPEAYPTVKICDFGISMMITPEKFNGQKKAIMKVRSGTAGYIGPEVKGSNIIVGQEVDMWAFGVILYELSVGYKPT